MDNTQIERKLSDMIFGIMSGNKEAAAKAFAEVSPHYQALAINRISNGGKPSTDNKDEQQ